MDLEASRSKQRAAQQQSQTQPDGVARIGDRDPLTGRYTVQFPDGGIGANGIKTYTAASKPGDVVVLFPRADGSIAIDSEKGSPTIVPDVFNKPVPDGKKGGVWIFYRSAGKLWVGGHQEVPEEIATLSVVAPPSTSDFRPSGYHVWGDKNGWIATFQVTELRLIDAQGFVTDTGQAINFYCVTNNNQSTGQNVTRKVIGQSSRNTYGSTSEIIPSHSVFPLGGGIVSFRTNVTPSLRPVGSGGPNGPNPGDFVTYTFTGSVAASVGYLDLGVASVESFDISHVNVYTNGIIVSGGTIVSRTASTHRSDVSFDGTTRIPNVGICQYKGDYVSRIESVFLAQKTNTPREYNTQSILTYAIMCDRSATYYIRETVSATGITIVNAIDYSNELAVASPILGYTALPQRKYELFSSASAQVLATNLSEPRFFGIRWDLRDLNGRFFVFPPDNASLIATFYDDPPYYFSFIAPAAGSLGSTDNGVLDLSRVGMGGTLPVGYYRRSRSQPTNSPPLVPLWDYDDGTPVTYSGGSVVLIPATEIFKATIGDGYIVRKVVAISGAESTITSAYCYAIPANAEILHWSTTTV